MKKIAILGIMLMLAGCEHLANMQGGADISVRGKMQSCMMTEAQSRLQAGTLFTNTVTATAKELVGVCMKRLALQSAGISAESQSAAENIITNLQALRNAQ